MTPSNAQKSLQAHLLMLVLGWVTLVWLGAAVMTWVNARHELDELLDGLAADRQREHGRRADALDRCGTQPHRIDEHDEKGNEELSHGNLR